MVRTREHVISMSVSISIAVVVAMSTIGGVARAQLSADSVQALGRHYTAQFYTGDIAGLEARFTPAMRVQEDSVKLSGDRTKVTTQLGPEHSLVREEIQPKGPWQIYVRTITVDNMDEPVAIEWTIGADGMIGGFHVKPVAQQEAPSTFLGYVTKTPLRLPFSGEWLVLWGGRTIALNQHAASPDQRFAYDFVVARNGATHQGAGTANSDYYAFGMPVLATGAGTVVDVIDSLADNAPGTPSTGVEALGNHVVIDHGNGEFSFVAHLQHGSITVKAGDHVAQGAVLGKCGNSGNSVEPHLHYHMQSTPSFLVGAGMPAQFEHYTADGKPVTRGEPARGQVVHPT
jgi:murein DD-endopeptidase MepM/ murein hydrolase activator NlpD